MVTKLRQFTSVGEIWGSTFYCLSLYGLCVRCGLLGTGGECIGVWCLCGLWVLGDGDRWRVDWW